MSDKIPVFKAIVSEGKHGVSLISLVDEPAIESNFIRLKKEVVKFAKDGKKQILTGAVLIPDKKIIRADENGDPYYITFSEDDIELVRDKFFKEGNINLTNKEHGEELSGNVIVESWLVEDSKNDKSIALGLGEFPKGTWLASYKVQDTKFWNEEVMTGNVNGFSIEGLFEFVKLSINNNNMEKKKITTGEGIKAAIAALSSIGQEVDVELAVLNLEDGTVIELDEDTLEVFLIDEEGNRGDLLTDGSYVLADGEAFDVVDGKWVKVEAAAEETEEEKKKKEEEEAELNSKEVVASKAKAVEAEANVTKLAKELETAETEKVEAETKLSSVTEAKEKAEKELVEANEKIAELSKGPAALPVEEDNKGKNEKPMSLIERATASAR